MDSEEVKSSETRTEESSKRAGNELESDKSKKQKIDEHIVKDDEVAIDALPLATKLPVIVEYKIDKDGRMGYFKLIRADGSSKRPEEDYERVLWGDLKLMFEPDIKSEIQKINIKFRGGLLGLKDFKMILRVTAAQEGSNGNVKGVNGGVRGAPDFSTIIAQQLQNLLPAILAQVGNQGNDGNQNGNVVNENVQENVRNVSVNGNRIKTELWNHVMVGDGHTAYTERFHELARLVPHLVTLESRKIKRYVYDLAPQIRGMVAAKKPKTMQKAVQIVYTGDVDIRE
ncbi:hypothetical protein Tco_0926917 [Tanacetum coccineum]|uniref:Reverse transcriptase domain-containing protein n=1 Tax=Tanacetum coccineum TaxID=301880 RepID=A0ABQ5DD53_9ASTR